MNISFESKGDFDVIMGWLKDVSNRSPARALNQIGADGAKSLSAHTPKSTSETASGWKSRVDSSGDVSELIWYNIAHPEARVSIARLIDTGHGTGTGGYVPPKPYIRQAMNPVWAGIDNKLIKELIR